MIEIKTILYPTDFSDYADHAKPYVIELAKKFGAKVVVIHVIADPVYATSYEISIDSTTLRDALKHAAEKHMGEIVRDFKDQGVEAEAVIEIGSAFVHIVTAARERDADLIVLASHGWGAFKHLLLGSTAERVVRKAPCPVLTVRHPEHEFVHP